MEIIVLAGVSFFAAGLTFFSGFGLGTILMPLAAVFFPLDAAIALTAVVHFTNNIFKAFLVYRYAHVSIIFRFGLPAVMAAMLGAAMLVWGHNMPPLFSYTFSGNVLFVTPIKCVIAGVMMVFVILETHPRFSKITFSRRYLPIGGLLSGFFGGLSGHQGALRTMFLLKSGLSKDSLIATGVIIACIVDITRLGVYANFENAQLLLAHADGLLAVVVSAFAGSFLGNRILRKVTLPWLQKIILIMIFIFALFLAAGMI
jgi:uncharacterized protein